MLERRRSAVFYGWLILLGVGVLWGLFTAFRVLTLGHGPLFNTTNLTPWGLLIALYLFLVLTSTGLTFVSSLSLVFGMKKYHPIAKRASFLAIVTLLTGFLVIGLDLGRPFRSITAYLNPNLSSAMWWMSAFYFLKLVLLIIKFWTMQTGRWESRLGKVSGIGSLLADVAATSTLGSIFGFIIARPGYFGAFNPVYFLLIALLSGFAFIMLFTFVTQALSRQGITGQARDLMEQIGKDFVLVLGIAALFFVWRTLVGLYPGATARGFTTVRHAMTTFWWQAEVWLGLVIPLTLLGVPALRKRTWAIVLAPLFALEGLFMGRMELVLLGQYGPVLQSRWMPEPARYVPSFWEWSVLLFAGCVVLALYTLGERFFDLAAVRPASVPIPRTQRTIYAAMTAAAQAFLSHYRDLLNALVRRFAAGDSTRQVDSISEPPAQGTDRCHNTDKTPPQERA